jgi:cytochrome P450
MPRVDELELPNLDYTDPSLRGEHFHTVMRELRAQGWLATGPYGYAVLDREAVEFFLRTRSAVFPGMTIAEIFDVREGPLYEEMRRNILHINGPDHTRLRSLVNPALSPRAVERYRPVMRELLQSLFAQIDGAHCEFVESIAKPYPSQAIAYVMGAPLADAPRLHHWSNWIQRQFDAVSMMEQKPGIEQAVAEFYEYAWALVRARRQSPGEDLISLLIAAEEQGERLSDVECVNLVLNVLIGGVDTSQSQLAHALRLFAEHPDQWALLAEHPELAAQAVEEALRFEPITPFTARIVTEELTFRDVTFPAGTIVMVCAFTGNRDLPEGPASEGSGASGERSTSEEGAQSADDGGGDGVRMPNGDPDQFDITADRGRARALTFGAGVHYCLGANLARVELQEALAFLAPRMPGLELAGEPVFEGITGIYGLAELPLRFAG